MSAVAPLDAELPPSFASFTGRAMESEPLRRAVTAATRPPEPEILPALLDAAEQPAASRQAIRRTARKLVEALRAKHKGSGVGALVHEYSLSSQEGVALMCLAEALLRIPDDETRDALIRDKIAGGDWRSHLGGERSLFVNAATWGLVVTGKLTATVDDRSLAAALTKLVARCGEPVIRRGVDMAMRMMGEQFVRGETIREALKRARPLEARGFSYSYDMLGEAAATAEDAARYLSDYEDAIRAIGRAAGGRGVYEGPGISIKLSALHPRYARAKLDRVTAELLPRVRALALLAKAEGIGFNIDAEEADRLETSLDILEALALDPALAGWDGLGFVVQAYGKRCPAVLDFVIDLARRAGRRIMVRLVKGAYWDAEIKRAQVDGLADFPVFTRKVYTDVSYIASARKLLDARDAVFPQFATHNAQTLATIHHMAGPDFRLGDYEFQCLHGMGEPLYDEVVGKAKLNRPCRIYAPVGTHETLLAYLVRRLLENGANSSFVNRIADETVPVDELIADPVEAVRAMPLPGAPHAGILAPAALFPGRRNSDGLDLANEDMLLALREDLETSAATDWSAAPTLASAAAAPKHVTNPADVSDIVGEVREASVEEARAAIRAAAEAAPDWARVPVDERAAMLERAADSMQARMGTLMGLAMREAGKSAPAAIAEVREAIDFLRYYAAEARRTLTTDTPPLGPVVCISPWNFPLAIFTGQAAAALVAGNTVLAKPAETTPLIAAESVRLLHEAGVPAEALQLVPCAGAVAGEMIACPQVAGVMFTGSTAVARTIQKQLSQRLSPQGKPVPLIAETGGQNAMIVDSSALAEQVVADVIASAFDSAGQRCSALRVLCLQEDVADRVLLMLKGAMRELSVGSTERLSADVGPVITQRAREGIEGHVAAMAAKGRRVFRIDLPPETAHGTFVAPTLIEIDAIGELEREVFGPVLHVLRFRRDRMNALIEAINATGYGLTFGLHTRLDGTIAAVTKRVEAGNLYVNRNTIGAIVGSQPFGGRGLSGTGPKAGGPLYLGRLVSQAPVGALPAGGGPDPSLGEFVRFLGASARPEDAERARVAGEGARLGLRTELPGPVGERNLYELHPRGRVLLMPETREGLVAQLAAAFATGNHAALVAVPDLHDALADLPASLGERLSRAKKWQSEGPYAAALVEGDTARVLAATTAIAALAGPLVPVQAASTAAIREANAPYAPNLLVEERVTSTNTTAAGGNASLMMLGS